MLAGLKVVPSFKITEWKCRVRRGLVGCGRKDELAAPRTGNCSWRGPADLSGSQEWRDGGIAIGAAAGQQSWCARWSCLLQAQHRRRPVRSERIIAPVQAIIAWAWIQGARRDAGVFQVRRVVGGYISCSRRPLTCHRGREDGSAGRGMDDGRLVMPHQSPPSSGAKGRSHGHLG